LGARADGRRGHRPARGGRRRRDSPWARMPEPVARSALHRPAMRLIAIRDAVKSYGSRTVLRGIDLEVGERARIGVIGQNGSGKSTLLRILAGLDEPDSAPAVRRRGMSASYLPQLGGPDPRPPT